MPTTDDLNRAEEQARAADAKRDRRYTKMIIVGGIVGGVMLVIIWSVMPCS